jgi:hypothetical protein
MAFREVVINRDLMSGVEQFFRADGTNITGTAGDKNIHAPSVKKIRGGESSKEKKPPRARRRDDGLKTNGGILEPAFFAGDVGGDKILVALRQVDDAFDETDDSTNATSQDADNQLNDAFLGVAKVEFMDAKAAQQNAEDAGHDFLFCSRRFVAHSF